LDDLPAWTAWFNFFGKVKLSPENVSFVQGEISHAYLMLDII
jgi:hypothetical protein